MTFTYQRTVRFQDTDAAGVVYFANVLAMCHEAYEESLIAVGIDLKSFFTNSNVAIPIVHASVDFLRPIFCGDTLVIHLILKQVYPDTFEIAYQITKTDQLVAKAVTKHVCIDPTNRIRQKLPGNMIQWFNGIELQEE